MKSFLSAFFIGFLPVTVIAQTDDCKTCEYKLGISASINSVHGQFGFRNGAMYMDGDGNLMGITGNVSNKSFSLSITPKYCIRTNLLLRSELGLTRIYFLVHNEVSGSYYTIEDGIINQYIIRLIPGLQWNLYKKKRFEAFAGPIMPFYWYGKLTHDHETILKDLNSDTLYQSTKYNTVTEGGWAAGLGVFLGLNFYISKRLSFGTEISSSAFYYHAGGNSTFNMDVITKPNPQAAHTEENNQFTYRGVQFAKIITSFTVSIWL